MEKNQERSIYDLAVIGNGIAAQSFLWNLTNKSVSNANKSQNFSIAHVYSPEIAPACSLRSSATVSLNGIEEDVSPLGNDMREAFFLFDTLYKDHRPEGVELVMRTVVGTSENETKKLLRRYKTLNNITSDKIKNIYPGSQYPSYLVSPEIFSKWINKKINLNKTDYPLFVKDITKVDEIFQITLQNNEVILAQKILFATGAFAKIFEKFFTPYESESIEIKNIIKAGSYLEREIDLGDKSFYLSIDGHEVLYRKNSFESKLILGNVSTLGAFEGADIAALNEILLNLKAILTFDFGNLSDFKIVTGLRHKGPRRLAITEVIDTEKRLFRINGLYKNGYTLGFLAAKRMEKLIFTS